MVNQIPERKRDMLRELFLAGASIRKAAAQTGINKITANTLFRKFRQNLMAREEWDEKQRTGLSFGQARDALFLGRRVRRSIWETFIFGVWDPTMIILLGDDPDNAPESEGCKMWFALPDNLHCEYADDRYIPTITDMLAIDWEIEP